MLWLERNLRNCKPSGWVDGWAVDGWAVDGWAVDGRTVDGRMDGGWVGNIQRVFYFTVTNSDCLCKLGIH